MGEELSSDISPHSENYGVNKSFIFLWNIVTSPSAENLNVYNYIA